MRINIEYYIIYFNCIRTMWAHWVIFKTDFSSCHSHVFYIIFYESLFKNTVEKFRLKLPFSLPLITRPILFVEFPFFRSLSPWKKVSSYISRLCVQIVDIATMFPWEYTNVESINTMLLTKYLHFYLLYSFLENTITSILWKTQDHINSTR